MDGMTLAAIRKCLGYTQVEVAASMGVPQSAVSRIEHQSDLLVSTLSKYLDALGGQVELVVKDGQRKVKRGQVNEPTP